jgi:hypothetical protein
MSVCLYSVFVLSCVQVAADPRLRSPTDFVKDQEIVESGQLLKKGCRAIDRYVDR